MLSKSSIDLILSEWSYWRQSPPASIPRRALHSITALQNDLVLVIQGVRRCGKSTLMAQIMTTLQLNPLDCTFVNFEDPRLSDALDFQLLDAIRHSAHQRRPKAKRHYFFLDEIQNVAGWQKWLHTKSERPGADYFVITGSNAALLSGDLATALTGRHTTVELFPFDWTEFRAAKPTATLTDFLQQGGFPRALSYEHPAALLREYCTDIIERDVRRHVATRSPQTLVQLVKTVLESTGAETSLRKLAAQLGSSADTVGTYLDACAAAYLLLPCPYFTFSERQRTARHRKYYAVDSGLRHALITRTGQDLGKDLEAAVFLHLRRHYRQVGYWKQRGEVDFVVSDTNGITPIQVSWGGKKPRHDAALQEFFTEFPQANSAICISAENAATHLDAPLRIR